MSYLKRTISYQRLKNKLSNRRRNNGREKQKPQTTHGSEQNEGKELIEIASSLVTDYNNQTTENLLEYSSRLIRYVNN